MDEQCVVCGTSAAVRVGGTSFCGSCGVKHYAATKPDEVMRRPRRAKWFSLLTSSLLLKSLFGAVAVAAVGGVAGTALQPAEDPVLATTAAPETAVVATTTEAPTITLPSVTTAAAVDSSQVQEDGITSPVDQEVAEFVFAVQSWADCVAEKASAHSGGRFDPVAECGARPSPADYSIGNSGNAPGHGEDGPGNSGNAPGHGEDGPGNSGNAPGQSEDGPGNSGNAPGQADKEK